MTLPSAVWFPVSLLIVAGISSTAGNLMLRQSRLDGSGGILSWWFVGGLMFYGLNVVLFATALDRVRVAIAYPILAGTGFALLTLASAYFLGERPTLVQLGGLILIFVGIVTIARPA